MNLPFRSLRATLLVPFVLLVTAVAGTVSYLSYSAGVRGAEDMSRRLLEDVAIRIAQATTQYLATSSVVLNVVSPDGSEAAVDSAEFNALSPVLITDVEKRLWIASGLYPEQNSYVYYGSETGRFVGIERSAPGGPEVRLRAQPNEPRRVYRAISPEKRGALLREEDFNPHERPWYRLAVERGRKTWTPLYKNFSSGDLTITLAKPILRADGSVRGVAATDMSLTRLSKFVRDLKISENGVAFVVEPDGALVATSSLEDGASASSARQRKLAAQHSSAFVRDAYAALSRLPAQAQAPQASGSTAVRHLPFESALGAAFLSSIDYRDDAGLNWRFIVAVPRADHMAPVYRSMAENLAVSAAALLIAIALGAWVLHRVANDVSSVSRAAARLISGQGPITAIPDREDEIGALASSMAAIQDQLWFDKLTGALNRDAFSRQFAHAVDSLPDDERLAVVYIDLDRFKKVNDRHGHAVGDAVLAKSAERIRRRLREKDLFARYGGDEFVIMVRGNAAVAAINALAERLRERLSLGMTIGEAHVAVGASIGVAIFPEDGTTLDELVEMADSRMYDAKRKAANARRQRKLNMFVSAP